MPLHIIVLIVIIGLLCFLTGFAVSTALFSPKVEGELVIISDKDDKDGPYLYLNINKHPDKLQEGQTAIFVVTKKER